MKIIKGADNIVRYVGPINGADNTSINDDDYANVLSTFRVYNERMEHTLGRAPTHVRTDVAASTLDIEIPYFEPQVYYAGDTVNVTMDNGLIHTANVLVVTRGTDTGTPATNFDTLTLNSVVTDTVSAGASFFMSTKGNIGTNIPIMRKDEPLEYGGSIRVTRNSGVEQQITAGVNTVVSITQDGVAASSQEEIEITQVGAVFSSTVDAGRIIRQEVVTAADPVGMNIYPVSPGPYPVGSDAWGYAGTYLASETVSLEPGQRLRIEISFNGDTTTPGLEDKKSIFATVVEQ